MESPSPVSPGGSVLDRVMMFEKKEQQNIDLARSMSPGMRRLNTSTQRHERTFARNSVPPARRAGPTNENVKTSNDSATIPTSPTKQTATLTISPTSGQKPTFKPFPATSPHVDRVERGLVVSPFVHSPAPKSSRDCIDRVEIEPFASPVVHSPPPKSSHNQVVLTLRKRRNSVELSVNVKNPGDVPPPKSPRREEAAVEEVAWPSEGIEDFPTVSWPSSADAEESEIARIQALNISSVDNSAVPADYAPESENSFCTDLSTVENGINDKNDLFSPPAASSLHHRANPALPPVPSRWKQGSVLQPPHADKNTINQQASSTVAAPAPGDSYDELVLLDDAMSTRSSYTSSSAFTAKSTSNLTVQSAPAGGVPRSPRSHLISQIHQLEQKKEDEERRGTQSPSRVARHIRASRLRTRNASVSSTRREKHNAPNAEAPSGSTQILGVSSSCDTKLVDHRQQYDSFTVGKQRYLAARGDDHTEQMKYSKSSDSDGPPKIMPEPGKLTAGIRPTSPVLEAPAHSPLSCPWNDHKQNSEGNATKPGILFRDVSPKWETLRTSSHRLENKQDSMMVAKGDNFEYTTVGLVSIEGTMTQATVVQSERDQEISEVMNRSGDDESESHNTSDFNEDSKIAGIANHAHLKVPRSLANRRERFHGQRGRILSRHSPTKALFGTSSHDDDTYSVATDTTPITRPGRSLMVGVSHAIDDITVSRLGWHEERNAPSPTPETATDEATRSEDIPSAPLPDEGLKFVDRPMPPSPRQRRDDIEEHVKASMPERHSEATEGNQNHFPSHFHVDSSKSSLSPQKRNRREVVSSSEGSFATLFKPIPETQEAFLTESTFESRLALPPGSPDTAASFSASGRKDALQKPVSPVHSPLAPKTFHPRPTSPGDEKNDTNIAVQAGSDGAMPSSIMAVSNDNLSLWWDSSQSNPISHASDERQANQILSYTKSLRVKTDNLTVDHSAPISNGSSSVADDLAIWWQSTYAATQQPEVNKVIEQALSPGPSATSRKSGFSSPRSCPAKNSPRRRPAKNTSTSTGSPRVIGEKSSTGGDSTSRSGNDGDTEGGSSDLLEGAVSMSKSSPESDQSKKSISGLLRANDDDDDDDDVFNGIEDDEQSIDKNTEGSEASDGNKAEERVDDVAGEFSLKGTSTCDDTHTTDLLNSLDEDSPRGINPWMRYSPNSPRRLNRILGSSAQTTGKIPTALERARPAPLTIQADERPSVNDPLTFSEEARHQEHTSKEEENVFEFQWAPDVQQAAVAQDINEGKSTIGGQRISASALFESISCAFIESVVMGFCQDPKGATDNIVNGICRDAKMFSGFDSDSAKQSEERSEATARPLDMSLSEKEKMVWKDWDRKNESVSSGQKVKDTIKKMNTVDQNLSTLGKDDNTPRPQGDSFFVANVDENIPKHMEIETEDTSSVLPSPHALRSPKRYVGSPAKSVVPFKPLPSPAKSVSSIVSPRSSRAGQRQLLERFCAKLRNDGMEVLKLSSDKIWQVRYLTVSKEISWLHSENNDDAGDRGHCPKGLLWVKKFTSNREQSVNNIDRHGKGGILFAQVSGVEELAGKHIPMSKKQLQGKFKDSVVVVLKGTQEAGSTRIIYIRCRTRQEALVLCAGCNMIVKMLNVKESDPAPIKTITPAIVSKGKDDAETERAAVAPDNDLWEV